MVAQEALEKAEASNLRFDAVLVDEGQDFSCVFLIGIDYLELKDWTEEQVKNLVYVGITRAKYQLYIPYIRSSLIIKKLLLCY